MAALAGINRYHLENVLNSQFEFEYMYRNGRFYGTYVNSFNAAYSNYQERIEHQKRCVAKKNFNR